MAQDPSELDPVDPELDLEDESTDPAGEPDLDDVDEEEADVEVAPQPEDRQPSRRDARIQRLHEDSRRKDAENADLRRRLDELTARTAAPAPPQPRQESDEERAARYESMSPGQAMVEALKEAEARFSQRMNTSNAQNADSVDKTTFDYKASTDALYAKWAPKVEARLAELRRQGINMNREVLFKFMVGEAAIERRSSPAGKQETSDARRRVQRRTARPGDSGSDTASTREQRRGNSDAAALERRLANVQI
jgi:hypothetical protein